MRQTYKNLVVLYILYVLYIIYYRTLKVKQWLLSLSFKDIMSFIKNQVGLGFFTFKNSTNF